MLSVCFFLIYEAMPNPVKNARKPHDLVSFEKDNLWIISQTSRVKQRLKSSLSVLCQLYVGVGGGRDFFFAL